MNITSADTPTLDPLKQQHRAIWDSGNYASVAETLVLDVADAAIAAADLRPGDTLLDVATGSGNAAIPAAIAGLHVTGLDLAPTLIDVARARGAAAGVDVDWVVGDAEALPFPDASFDVVLSVLGVQFAPHHEQAARELARVVKPGGQIVLCNWTPSGFIGQFFATIGPRMPKPPQGVSAPPLWGDEAHVRALFEGTGVAVQAETRSVVFDHSSSEGFVDYMADNYGPLLKARERLDPQGAWQDLRAELVALCERSNLAADGFMTGSEYLVVRGRKHG